MGRTMEKSTNGLNPVPKPDMQTRRAKKAEAWYPGNANRSRQQTVNSG